MLAVFLLVLALVAGVGLTLLSGEDSGYLLLAWNDWRVEVYNLVVALALILALFLLLHWLLNSFSATQRQRRRWRDWLLTRRRRRGQRDFIQGLLHLAEGHWGLAEKKLTSSCELGHSQVLGWLGAAQAADHLGQTDRRDRYLAAAARGKDGSVVAVGLQRAQFLADQGQLDQAIEILHKLREAEPKHPVLLDRLQQAYLQHRDWQGLLALLPALRRQKLIDHSQARVLDRQCHRELLKEASSLHEAWLHLPKKYSHDGEMLALYLQALVDDGQAERALELAQRELSRELSSSLLELFGKVDGGDPVRSLALLEKWLVESPTRPDLLLAAGRLASRAGLTEKAIGFYEALQAVHADPTACAELAQLLIPLQRTEAALATLELGLELALRPDTP